MVVKVDLVTGHRLPIHQVLGLKASTIDSEDELSLLPCRGRALSQSRKGGRHRPLSAHLQVNIVALEHTTRQV